MIDLLKALGRIKRECEKHECAECPLHNPKHIQDCGIRDWKQKD